LVTYLEIIEALHRKYAELAPEALHKEESDPNDVLSRWAIEYLLQSTDKSWQPCWSCPGTPIFC